MASALTINRAERRRMMLTDPVGKVVTIIAIPMIISMMVDSLYNIADTYFVSQLGKAATAAVGVNDSMTHFIRSCAMGFGIGASSYMSRLLGAKKDEEACRVRNACPGAAVVLSHMDAVAHATVSRRRMRELMELRGVMDGFLMPVSCVRVSCAASDSSGEAVSGQSAGASGSYGSLSLFTRPSRSLMMRVA